MVESLVSLLDLLCAFSLCAEADENEDVVIIESNPVWHGVDIDVLLKIMSAQTRKVVDRRPDGAQVCIIANSSGAENSGALEVSYAAQRSDFLTLPRTLARPRKTAADPARLRLPSHPDRCAQIGIN
jgi:hypothetical protein